MYIKINEIINNDETLRVFNSDNVEGLVTTIQEYGVKQPISIDENNVIVDGHRRVKACKQLGIETIEYQVVKNTIENVLLLNQKWRKKYSEILREGLEWEKILSVKAKQNQQKGGKGYPSEGKPFHTNVEVAKRLGIGKDTYFKLKKINEKQSELLVQIDSGDLSIKEAYSRVMPPRDTKTIPFPTPEGEPKEIPESQTEEEPEIEPDDGEGGEEPDNEDDENITPIWPTRNNTYDQEFADIEKADKLPQLVLADPPWRYKRPISNSRRIENHYQTLTIEEIFNHKPETSENAILMLWATYPLLVEALSVMDKWGFEYKTMAIWDKLKIGMGYWFRGQHEILLVGVKGKISPPAPHCRHSSIFQEKRGKHSVKPEAVFSWIEEAFPHLTKLEMYARTPREGWVQWGDDPAIVEKNNLELNTAVAAEEEVEVGGSAEATAEDESSSA